MDKTKDVARQRSAGGGGSSTVESGEWRVGGEGEVVRYTE